MSTHIWSNSKLLLNPVFSQPRVTQSSHYLTKKTNWLKYCLITLGILLLFVIISFVSLHAFITWQLSHPKVDFIRSNPYIEKQLAFNDISFPAADGKSTVEGWYIGAEQSKKTIIFSHGYGANREEPWVPMYDLAAYANSEGYNTLLFDYGFASKTSKTIATGGITESQQLLGAIDFAKKQGAEHIVVWGFSMGAGTALQTALKTNDIDAMILDSTFLLEADTLIQNLQRYLPLPRDLSLSLVRFFCEVFYGTSYKYIPAETVKTTDYNIPLYVIHGTADHMAPYEVAEQIGKGQTHPLSKTWVVDSANHELIYRVDPEQYQNNIKHFLSELHL